MRPTWTGYITIGMLNIPIKLYKAVDGPVKISFNEINDATGNRVSRKKVDAVTKDDVSNDDIVKGVPVGKDQYVTFRRDEINDLLPERSKVCEVMGFVDQDQVSTHYHDEPYWLETEEIGRKAATTLAKAMRETNTMAIGRVVFRQTERLCALMPNADDDGLEFTTLRWAEQIRQAPQVMPVEPSEHELQAATSLVENMRDKVAINELTNTYNEELTKMVTARAEGGQLVEGKAEVEASYIPSDPDSFLQDLFATIEQTQKDDDTDGNDTQESPGSV